VLPVAVQSLVSHSANHGQPRMMRVVCVSDTHSMHRTLGTIPDGDVLVHAGDFTQTGTLAEVQDFCSWLGSLPHEHKIVIAGNHETTFDESYYHDNWKRFHPENKQDVAMIKSTLSASGCKIYHAHASCALALRHTNINT